MKHILPFIASYQKKRSCLWYVRNELEFTALIICTDPSPILSDVNHSVEFIACSHRKILYSVAAN